MKIFVSDFNFWFFFVLLEAKWDIKYAELSLETSRDVLRIQRDGFFSFECRSRGSWEMNERLGIRRTTSNRTCTISFQIQFIHLNWTRVFVMELEFVSYSSSLRCFLLESFGFPHASPQLNKWLSMNASTSTSNYNHIKFYFKSLYLAPEIKENTKLGIKTMNFLCGSLDEAQQER